MTDPTSEPASDRSAPPEPTLVPELTVTDLAASLAFWRELCGFAVVYDRPEEGFAYLALGSAHVMLDQRGIGRDWITAEAVHPFGRGINLQISVPTLDPILRRMAEVGHPLFLEPETRWYRVGARREAGVRQFLVTDPDGYLVRFQESLGEREST
ncbi:VOC family protein [Schumannella sp. 10F1B-5-1]|uniref:bleomycin resistance protein n=1 Tax=Schumannella sp. 10F1B-5-1 TaxID=2590780 RepID=UPI0011311712|nr:VOC family protein [Schumannella sp. 10F1B-5-1]TPW78369.1 VOC family protein [Schumannella sp. 10F1B-5-1]